MQELKNLSTEDLTFVFKVALDNQDYDLATRIHTEYHSR